MFRVLKFLQKIVLSKCFEYIVEFEKVGNFSVRYMIEGDKGKGEDQKFFFYFFSKIVQLGFSICGWIYRFVC